MDSSREVGSKVLRMVHLIKSILMRKVQNGECNNRNMLKFFLRMSSDVPVFKVPVFASDFEF